jgi:hypothetical protein
MAVIPIHDHLGKNPPESTCNPICPVNEFLAFSSCITPWINTLLTNIVSALVPTGVDSGEL